MVRTTIVTPRRRGIRAPALLFRCCALGLLLVAGAAAAPSRDGKSGGGGGERKRTGSGSGGMERDRGREAKKDSRSKARADRKREPAVAYKNITAYSWAPNPPAAAAPFFSSFPEVTPGSPWAIPSLLERPPLAVSFGGAGARAAPLAYGWARALSRMGVLPRARHLSATSAAAWLAAPYCYRGGGGGGGGDDDTFFGSWLQPESLGPTTADLAGTLSAGSWGGAVAGKAVGGGGGAAAASGGGGTLGALLASAPPPLVPQGAVTPWSADVAAVYLRPFRLDASASPTAVGTAASDSAGRAAESQDGVAAALASAAEGGGSVGSPFLLDAIRATRDGGLLGLVGAAFEATQKPQGADAGATAGGGGGGGGRRTAPPTFDASRGLGRPFPIIVATADGDAPFFELTPLYAGSPAGGGVLVEPFGANARMRPAAVREIKEAARLAWEGEQRAALPPALAGAAAAGNATLSGAAEPPPLPERPADMPYVLAPGPLGGAGGGGAVELPLQSPAGRGAQPLSLAAVVGAASAPLPQQPQQQQQQQQQVYLPASATLGGAWTALSEGAATDGTAVLAALRRAPTHLVACVSAASLDPDVPAAAWAASEPAVAALFGAGAADAASSSSSSSSSSPSAASAKDPSGLEAQQQQRQQRQRQRRQQVFPRADYELFYTAMRRAWLQGAEGGPSAVTGFKDGPAAPLRLAPAQAARTAAPVFRTRHAVLPNALAGVRGGHDVEVLWVVNARSGAFESRLPAAVRALVQGGRSVRGSVSMDFPFVASAASASAPEIVALLSQQADWQLREGVERVAAFVDDVRRAEQRRARAAACPAAAGAGAAAAAAVKANAP